ncbi:MAG: hypothetical protein ACXW61_14010 [Gemmatirosa sp.]
MSEPHFTDDERALILRRAAELQLRQGEAVHRLSDVEHDAAAAGIDPRLVRRVARELGPAVPDVAGTRAQAAGDARVVVRRRADDVRLPIASSAVLGAIRRHSPELGEVRGLGDGFEWRYDTGYSASAVVLAPSGTGAVDVEVTGDFEGRHLMLHLAPFALAGITALATAAMLPALGTAALGVGTLAGGLAGARAIWRRVARREQVRLERLADAVVDALAADRASDA